MWPELPQAPMDQMDSTTETHSDKSVDDGQWVHRRSRYMHTSHTHWPHIYQLNKQNIHPERTTMSAKLIQARERINQTQKRKQFRGIKRRWAWTWATTFGWKTIETVDAQWISGLLFLCRKGAEQSFDNIAKGTWQHKHKQKAQFLMNITTLLVTIFSGKSSPRGDFGDHPENCSRESSSSKN